MPAFMLSKWYLDCVTDSGDASIAYTGTVRWGMVRLHYSSLLETTGICVSERHSLRKQREPEAQDFLISWRAKTLKMDGEWRCGSRAFGYTSYKFPNGA